QGTFHQSGAGCNCRPAARSRPAVRLYACASSIYPCKPFARIPVSARRRDRDSSSVSRNITVDLRYDTEHALLRSSADKFLSERYDYRTSQKISDSAAGWDRAIWHEFADLGWLGLPFAQEDGGSGGGAVELSILMEAFGRHLVVEPYL